MRTAVVIGTGLVGTSAALALAGRGIHVHLVDHDPASARTAAALGAGTEEAPEELIALLQRDATQSYAALGKAVGLSAGAAHERV
ncbi:FAD-dependent oxidoreductase, partial [Streptomyces sp. NPDC079189]|uniref:AsnC family protein n=1 Tax=Streptomyces sp. NPDC079189 TaxID=3154514 RepID=UPI00343D38DA